MKLTFNIYLDILDIVVACPPSPPYCRVARRRIASRRPASRSPHIVHQTSHLTSLPTLPSHRVVCRPLPLALHCPASPSSFILYLLAPQTIARFDCCIQHNPSEHSFFRTQLIVNVVVGTITITPTWTGQSSLPTTNLFIIMLLSSSSLMLRQFSMVMDV
jgi:hypothetical protein